MMNVKNYIAIAAVVITAIGAASASADTKRVNKGRAGFGYVNVQKKKEVQQVRQQAEKPQKTIGLFIGTEQNKVKKRSFTGGRNNAAFRKNVRY